MNIIKKILIVIICLPFIGFGQPSNVNIPDANFKAYLVGNTAINTNGDNEIQVSEATPFVGSINCSGLGIFDLTGIEAFTALTSLNCEQNQLAGLDVSANTALIELVCSDNQLTSLDVSSNTNLFDFFIRENQLTSLDVSSNTALEELFISENQITELDVSNNTALEELSCGENQLTSLDVSNNTALISLVCGVNQLTSLDVSNNTALEELDCGVNKLTSLDVSSNTVLTELFCNHNELTSLDVRNGNNTAFTNFVSTNNPNLFCINVDDNGYSAANWTVANGNIDSQHYFSLNCSPTNSIYDIIDLSPSHSTLRGVIDTCGLDGTLQGPGPFTVFAPTDAAFNLLPAGTLTALLADIPQLTDILKYHVVGDSVMSSMLSNNQVVTALLGTDVTVTITGGNVYIDNAMVTVADIVADNGVVHVIDAVLLPTTTSVSELNHLDKEYIYSINILGEKINRNLRNQIIFDVYIDGSITKRYVR